MILPDVKRGFTIVINAGQGYPRFDVSISGEGTMGGEPALVPSDALLNDIAEALRDAVNTQYGITTASVEAINRFDVEDVTVTS